MRDSLFARQLLEDVRVLASEAMGGRATGTVGAERAREYLIGRLEAIGVEPWAGRFRHPFAGDPGGVNLIGWLPGEDEGASWLLVLAHHDHLGRLDGELHPGADDNASGLATLLGAAAALAERPRRRGVLLVSPDGEEEGQAGSMALAADPPFPLERVGLVVNLDMLSRSERGELWVAGTAHHAALAPALLAAAARSPVTVRLGHDQPDPDDERFDWSSESDHAAFHELGLPWLYFGVEDHPDYHTPNDTFERIDAEFFVGAAATAVDFLTGYADGEDD